MTEKLFMKKKKNLLLFPYVKDKFIYIITLIIENSIDENLKIIFLIEMVNEEYLN